MSQKILSASTAISALATLSAAFAGAWAAFLLEQYRHRKAKKQKHKAAANRTLFAIASLWNSLYNIYEHAVVSSVGDPNAWFHMPATFVEKRGIMKFDAENLGFLLDEGYPNVYQQVVLEEQRYWQVMNLIEMRTSLLVARVHSALGAAGVPVGMRLAVDQVERLVGIDAVNQLKHLTKGIMEQIPEDIESLIEAHDSLRETMKKLYPKTKFVICEFKPLPEKLPQTPEEEKG